MLRGMLIDFGLLGASVAHGGKKLFPRPSRFYHLHLSLEIAASDDACQPVRDRLLKRRSQFSRPLDQSELSMSSGQNCQTVKLNNGLSIPILGLGTWKSKPGEVTKAVKDAIDVGYRHIDCAHVYQNEKEVGAALKAKMDDGKIKREDIFITSKLWNTFHKRELVEPALKASLKNLGLSYLDLYLIHWPMAYKEGGELFPAEKNRTLYSDSPYTETWKAMEECVKKGLVKSIGISNFNRRQTQDILNVADIKPVTNQVECHPYLNQEPLMEFCAQHGIILTAYSPLGSPDRPMAKPEDPVLLDDPLFKKIGDKYGKTPGQVLIRYQIERGNIVIPKSVNKGRIQQNFQVFDFKLSKEDMDLLNGIHKSNGRMIALTNQSNHKDYPFHDPF